MLEFEIQLNGLSIGSLIVSDDYQNKIKSLRETYLGKEDAADSVLLPVASSLSSGTHVVMRPDVNRYKHLASNALLDISKDCVVCNMTLDGSLKIKYDISKSF